MWAGLGKSSDADEERAAAIATLIDLGDWSEVEAIYAELAEVYGEGYVAGLKVLVEMTGAEPPAEGALGFGVSLDQLNELSVEWARARAAEAVTLIEDNTRSMLRATIADAVAEGWGADRLAEEIAASAGFSDIRAETIARTEISAANNRGNLDAYKASGVATGKEWTTSGNDPCDDCLENEAAGPIGLDDDFPSGDDCPPGHPRCECALLPVTEPLDSDSEGDDE